jgi:hypothetical protein
VIWPGIQIAIFLRMTLISCEIMSSYDGLSFQSNIFCARGWCISNCMNVNVSKTRPVPSLGKPTYSASTRIEKYVEICACNSILPYIDETSWCDSNTRDVIM